MSQISEKEILSFLAFVFFVGGVFGVTTMTDADREAFEKWWRSEVKERALAPSELHRKAWQAAIAYAAEVAEQYLAQAVEAEREACAKVADMEAIQAIGCNPVFVAHRIATAIRARKGGENG